MALGKPLQTAAKAIVAAQSDSVDLALPPDAVSIAVGGTLWISGITRIWSTGTAATGILCLYFTV